MHPAVRAEVEKETGRIESLRRLTGGDISELFCAEAARGNFVIKTHLSPPAGLFLSEAAGLLLLREHGLSVPEVFLATENFLLMEYLPPGKPHPAAAGKALAQLHSIGQPEYGLSRDTYLATLPQDNTAGNDWGDFFTMRRIFPLLQFLSNFNGKEQIRWQQFLENIKPLLAACPGAALLHGDLWSGNLYHAARGPVFIDPACYCGDPLVDIAMTNLFGGFAVDFYAAYDAAMPRRENAAELISIYQIYPLLVHARLFGGGYYASACAIRDKF